MLQHITTLLDKTRCPEMTCEKMAAAIQSSILKLIIDTSENMILYFIIGALEATPQNPKCPSLNPSNKCHNDVESEYFDCFGGCHFDKLCEKLCEAEAKEKVNQLGT